MKLSNSAPYSMKLRDLISRISIVIKTSRILIESIILILNICILMYLDVLYRVGFIGKDRLLEELERGGRRREIFGEMGIQIYLGFLRN